MRAKPSPYSPTITQGSMLCESTDACRDPWPFPRRVPGPRQTTFPACGRLCSPKALKPVAAGYNTSRSTGFPTFNTVPSWLVPKSLGSCPPELECPSPYWHDYSLGANGGSFEEQVAALEAQARQASPREEGMHPALAIGGAAGLIGVGLALMLLPFGVGAVAGAAMAPKTKRKAGAFYGALGGGVGGLATGSLIPGTGLLGAAVAGGATGRYIVPEMGK